MRKGNNDIFNNESSTFKSNIPPSSTFSLHDLIDISDNVATFNVTLDLLGNKINGLKASPDPSSIVILSELDNYIRKDDPNTGLLFLTGGTMQGSIDMDDNPITDFSMVDDEPSSIVNVDYCNRVFVSLEQTVMFVKNNVASAEGELVQLESLSGTNSLGVELSGDTMEGYINMGTFPIYNVKTPLSSEIDYIANVEYYKTASSGVASKIEQTDLLNINVKQATTNIEILLGFFPGMNSKYVNSSGATMTSNINLGGLSTISDFRNPLGDGDLESLGHMNNTFVPFQNGVMTGNIDNGNNFITGVKTPSISSPQLRDIVNVAYVLTESKAKKGLAGTVAYPLASTSSYPWLSTEAFIWDNATLQPLMTSTYDPSSCMQLGGSSKKLEFLMPGIYFLFFELYLLSVVDFSLTVTYTFNSIPQVLYTSPSKFTNYHSFKQIVIVKNATPSNRGFIEITTSQNISPIATPWQCLFFSPLG